MAVRSPVIKCDGRRPALKAARGLIRISASRANSRSRSRDPTISSRPATSKPSAPEGPSCRELRPGYSMPVRGGRRHEGSDKRHRWIVDPLDGTHNSLAPASAFCISIGSSATARSSPGVSSHERRRRTLPGPEKGGPAPISTTGASGCRRGGLLSEAIIGTGIPANKSGDPAGYGVVLSRSNRGDERRARFGAAALDLAYVAAGRLDGFWESASALGHRCRHAAGARGRRYVSDLAGGHEMMANGNVLAANDHLHLPLAALIREASRAG